MTDRRKPASSPAPSRSPSGRPPLQNDRARIDRVLGIREQNNPRIAQRGSEDGTHVWAASGLRGFSPGQQGDFWRAAGMKDAWSVLRKPGQQQPGEWVQTVSTKYNNGGR